MANDSQLIQYIQEQRHAGVSDDVIRAELIKSEWPQDKIDEGFQQAGSSSSNHGVPPQPGATLISFEDLVKRVWELFRENYGLYLLIVIGPFLIANMGSFITLLSGVSSAPNESLDTLLLGRFMGLGLIGSVLQSIAYLALVYAVSNRSQSPSVGEAYKYSFRNIFRYWGLMFIALLVVWGAAVLLMVPGLLASTWMLIVPFVFVMEKAKGYHAVKLSREYARGYGWQLFFRYAGTVILYIFVSGVISHFVGVAVRGLDVSIHVESLTALVSSLLGIVTAPLTVLVAYVLYTNLVEIKGRLDISGYKYPRLKILMILGVLGLFMIPIALMVIAYLFFTTLTM